MENKTPIIKNYLGEYNLLGNLELLDLLKECLQEIDEKLGDTVYKSEFEFCKDLTIQWGHTTGRTLGQVHYDKINYSYDYWGRRKIDKIEKATITIYDHKNRDTKGIKETIIHELIHTLKDCQNHKSEFKWHCSIIQGYMGYSCFSGQHEDVQSIEYILSNFKHFTVCEHCHKITSKGNRKTRAFQYPEFYYCSKCKSKIKYMTLEEVKGWL